MSTLHRFLTMCLLAFATAAHGESILVVTPADSAVAREFVATLAEASAGKSVELHLLGQDLPAASPSSAVTLGPDALEWWMTQDLRVPTVAAYIGLERVHSSLKAPLPAHLHILLSNPAPDRQIALARLILPRIRHLGILYTDRSESQLVEWRASAEGAGLEIKQARVGDPRTVGRAVAELLDRSDLLMALDDPQIYNADNLKALLLASYGRGKVLIGPGPAFIQAGSLSTTFSSPAEMARSTAQLLGDTWVGGQVSYPIHFSVSSNQHVARSLGLPPLDDEALAQAIRLMKASP
ncbi:hypothetical protein [Pseudomonas sp.]|uniref:hypothetical protein n=1 Tax=Pseudomonas sp. TaxID=306 RepID=UPI00272BB6F3|nr:hypothetical protein [Pseudomonas sp.]